MANSSFLKSKGKKLLANSSLSKMKKSQTLSSTLLPLLLLMSLATSLRGQALESESEFNYISGSEKGPENWGNIKEEWATCKTGRMQSPITLPAKGPERSPNSEKVIRSYFPGPTTLKNTGHAIELHWEEPQSRIQINGIDYILRQCHWHSPSEHALFGIRYALEVHFVHQSVDNKKAVIGFIYNLGEPDPFLSSIADKIRQISNNSKEVAAGTINPSDVRAGGYMYYRYMGSLTTPPCSENITWTVETQVRSVSKEQVQMLSEAVDNGASQNARPLQPLNGRRLSFYYDTSAGQLSNDYTIAKQFAESMYSTS